MPGLLAFGSRANHQVMLRVDEPRVEPLGRALRDAFRDRVRQRPHVPEHRERSRRGTGAAENYLSLVGLVVVILGGIGVSSVTRIFVEQKVKSIAILKCVGAGSRHVLGIYGLQVLALGLVGSLPGVGLAAIAIAAAAPIRPATRADGAPIVYGLTVAAVGQGVMVGVLVSRAVRAGAAARGAPRQALVALAAGMRVPRRASTGFGWRPPPSWGSPSSGSPPGKPARCASASSSVGGSSSSRSCCSPPHGCSCALTRPLRKSPVFALRHAVLNLDCAGQSDANRSARRRTRLFLHRRRPRDADESAATSSHRPVGPVARHVPD